MEKNIKLKVLDNIGKIYEESKECKLEESFFSKIENELSFLSEYFWTTKSQSFFISLVFALNYKGDTVDLNDLIEYFNCNPMKILEYSNDFNYLHSSGIFRKHKSKHRMKLAGANDQFTINEKISEAILKMNLCLKLIRVKSLLFLNYLKNYIIWGKSEMMIKFQLKNYSCK